MGEVRLRPATMNDAELLFDWRNDPLTRAQSLQRQPVEWREHLVWLANSLQNPGRRLYIGEAVTEAEQAAALLGTVRFDRGEWSYELSWTVAPDQRGKGWGKKLVAALIACLPAGACYRAVVLTDNPASQRIAAGLAMQPETRSATRIIFVGRKPEL
jgi:RimJ/RimL family protein N-acetyltransferase